MVYPEFYVAVVRAVADHEIKVDTRAAGQDLAGFPGPNGHEGMRDEPAMRETVGGGERARTGGYIPRDIYRRRRTRTGWKGRMPV